MGAWVPAPSRLSGALVRFFPDHIGLILRVRDSAREKYPANSFTQGDFSRLQPFVYLQAPILARPSGCSDLQFPFGHRALYTAQYLLRYRIQAAASLRVRIRTIDTTGLGSAFAAPHLLDRSLVGRSYTPISPSSPPARVAVFSAAERCESPARNGAAISCQANSFVRFSVDLHQTQEPRMA